jgi:hypothetical protein
MKLLLALVLGAVSAHAGDMIQTNAGTSPSFSTVTITGTGSKCFSVDDPTLVVDCNLNKVIAGGSGGLTVPSGSLGIGTADGANTKALSLYGAPTAGGTASSQNIWSYDGSELYFDVPTGVFHFRDSAAAFVDYVTISGSKVGIGTTAPGTTLDVNGNAQFGSGATKSTFTATGMLVVNPPALQTIAAGNTIAADACGSIKFITAGGAVTTDTTNTFGAGSAALNGCCMDVVVATSAGGTITVDSNSSTILNGGTDVVLGAGDSMRVCYVNSSSRWFQIGATGNN